MLVTRQPVLRRFRYALLPMSAFDVGPRPLTPLGEHLVVWKTADGTPAALRGRCCHRTAKLSKGHVIDGRIVCEPGYRRIFQLHQEWKTSPVRMMENSFDNAHFSFVHRATFGDAAQPVPATYALLETDYGFEGGSSAPILNPPAARRVTGTDAPIVTRHLVNRYHLPFARRFGCSYDRGIDHIIDNCATPIDDERMLLVQWMYRDDGEAQCSAEELIAWDGAVTAEYREMLHATDPDACVDTRRRRACRRPGRPRARRPHRHARHAGARTGRGGHRPTDCVVYPAWVNTHHHLFHSLLEGEPQGLNATPTPWRCSAPPSPASHTARRARAGWPAASRRCARSKTQARRSRSVSTAPRRTRPPT